MQVGDHVTIPGLPAFNITGGATAAKGPGLTGRTMRGEVIHCCRKHFTVDNGRYRETFLFKDFPDLDREQRKRR